MAPNVAVTVDEPTPFIEEVSLEKNFFFMKKN